MNIQNLEYVLEVAKTGSISQAAKNLYIGQPNLSKAIKELEKTLNITIFKRTSRGVRVTPQGREFLHYATNILQQYDKMGALGQREKQEVQTLRLSIPRASYIAEVFTNFLVKLDKSKPLHIDLCETNALHAIRHVAERQSDLAVIRCLSDYQNHFTRILEKEALVWQVILESPFFLLFAHNHPLAGQQIISIDDLQPYIEIVHGDTVLPHTPQDIAETEHGTTPGDKKIDVTERGSQFDILARVPGTYMWVSPMPADLLARNHLLQRCCTQSPRFKDLLVLPEEHEANPLEDVFIEELGLLTEEILSATSRQEA